MLLCETYGVSRPVLREATRVLVAKGLVVSKPLVGSVVRPRADWHMLDPDVLHWTLSSVPEGEPPVGPTAVAPPAPHPLAPSKPQSATKASSIGLRRRGNSTQPSSPASDTPNPIPRHPACSVVRL